MRSTEKIKCARLKTRVFEKCARLKCGRLICIISGVPQDNKNVTRLGCKLRIIDIWYRTIHTFFILKVYVVLRRVLVINDLNIKFRYTKIDNQSQYKMYFIKKNVLKDRLIADNC